MAAALSGLVLPATQPGIAKADAKYDLIHKLAPFMDVHLLFPVLNYYATVKLYKNEDILQAKVALSRPTKMVEFCVQMYKELHNTTEVPADLEAHQQKVFEEYDQAEDKCDALLAVTEDKDLYEELIASGNWTAEYLAAHHEVDAACIQAYYDCAKFKYECGEYNVAAKQLYDYLKLVPEGSPQELNALWGKLVSEILSEAWEEALQDLHKLKNAIDKSYLSALQQLQMKSWMLHWSLFIFFNHPSGMDELVDFFLAHIDTIQSNCPWLLRYLAATVLSNPRRANKMDEVVRVVVEEEYTYSDPITRFIKKLFVDYDFDGAQEELSECEAVLVTDIFLCRFSIDKAVIKHVVDEFMQHARMFVFESYCRIHRRIDLVVLAGKLGMPVSDAERWVVDLIGRASLNAKIDCSENHVLMTVQHASIYQRVINKTKDLSFRSYLLASGLERALHESSRRKNKAARNNKDAGKEASA